MTVPNKKVKFSYEDYQYLPGSEVKRYELIEGELIMVPAPEVQHQKVSRNLEFIIWQFVKKKDIGSVFYAPIDVMFSSENVLQPDIIYISKKRSGIITEKYISGAPDLVIEIISPSTSGRDKTLKRTLYAKYGVEEYWIVDPNEKNIQIYILKENGLELIGKYHDYDVIQSSLIKGLKINLKEVFAE